MANPLNKCVGLANGRHQCVCGAPGYVLSADRRRCSEPVDPCSSTRDLCSTKADAANTCYSAVDGTGSYQCTCQGVGWTTAPNGMSCTPPQSKCQTSDPCGSLQDANNRCEEMANGGHVCECNGLGWSASRTLDRCFGPNSICKQPAVCSTNYGSGNTCVDLPRGGYRCECGEGYRANAGNTACECLNPCLSGNKCNYAEVSHESTTHTHTEE